MVNGPVDWIVSLSLINLSTKFKSLFLIYNLIVGDGDFEVTNLNFKCFYWKHGSVG